MARGKYLSLDEARRLGKLEQLEQFAKEHPYEGDMDKWDKLFKAMIEGGPPDSIRKARASKTSGRGASEDCSETQIRPDTSEDASG